jgi:hypothetical protein
MGVRLVGGVPTRPGGMARDGALLAEPRRPVPAMATSRADTTAGKLTPVSTSRAFGPAARPQPVEKENPARSTQPATSRQLGRRAGLHRHPPGAARPQPRHPAHGAADAATRTSIQAAARSPLRLESGQPTPRVRSVEQLMATVPLGRTQCQHARSLLGVNLTAPEWCSRGPNSRKGWSASGLLSPHRPGQRRRQHPRGPFRHRGRCSARCVPSREVTPDSSAR